MKSVNTAALVGSYLRENYWSVKSAARVRAIRDAVIDSHRYTFVLPRLVINLLVSSVVGAIVVVLSPTPHDIRHAVGLLSAGLILGLILPSLFWAHYAGVLLGQLICTELFLGGRTGFLILLGGMGFSIVYFAASSIIALLGAAIGAGTRRLLKA